MMKSGIVRVLDFGGRTGRAWDFGINPIRRTATPVSDIVVQRGVNFSSLDNLTGHIVGCIGKDLPPGQFYVPISFAGPVALDRRRLIKYTNQPGAGTEEIFLAQRTEEKYKATFGRDIEVIILHDCYAAGLAESGPGGVVNGMIGALINPIVLGTGMGGRNFLIGEDGVIEPRDGSYELGHSRVPLDLIRKTGLAELIDDTFQCGCLIEGNRSEGQPYCLESLVAGPAISRLAARVVRGIEIYDDGEMAVSEPLKMRVAQDLNNIFLSMSEFLSNALLQQVIKANSGEISQPGQEKEAVRETLRRIAEKIWAPDLTEALKVNSEEPISMEILRRVTRLLAEKLEALQGNHEQIIEFVFVGGVGCNLGPVILPLINKHIEGMNQSGQRSLWNIKRVPQLQMHVGNFAADQTNLIGAARFFFLLEKLGYTRTGPG